MEIKLRVQNFKNLEDVTITLKDNVFLFGPNGAGKSSIIQSLLFLQKNILPLNINKKTNYLIEKGIDLGSFSEIVTNNDISREIIFTFSVTTQNDYKNFDPFYEINKYSDPHTDEEWEYKDYFDLFSRDPRHHDPYQIHNFSFLIGFSFQEEGFNFNRIVINDNITMNSYTINKNHDADWSWYSRIIADEEIRSSKGSHITRMGGYAFPSFNFLSSRPSSTEFHKKILNINLKSEYGFNIHISGNSFLINALPYNDGFLLYREGHIDSKEHLQYKSQIYDWIKNSLDFEFYQMLIKNENYENILNEFYLQISSSVDLLLFHIPTIINENIKSIYLEPVREIPRFKYYNEFHDINNCYYGIPGSLNVSQEELKSDLIEAGLLSVDNDYFSFFPVIRKIITSEVTIQNLESINKSYIYQLSKMLQQLNLAKSIALIKDEYTFRIILQGMNDEVLPLSSASSGMIQLLPILSYCTSFKTNTFLDDDFINAPEFEIESKPNLLLQQPELHLHPKLQSKLVEILLESQNRRNIIETHSEHMVRKLQVLISYNPKLRDKVAVHYISNNGGITNIREMKFEENGFFTEPWPDGFFDEATNLAYALLEAQIKRNN